MVPLFSRRQKGHGRSNRAHGARSLGLVRLGVEALEDRRFLSVMAGYADSSLFEAVGPAAAALVDSSDGIPFAEAEAPHLAAQVVDLPESFTIPAADRFDMVHDAKRGLLYITSRGGDVLRYHLAQRRFLDPIHLGGWPMGIDISPDQDMLVVANNTASGGQIWIHTIDLATGSVRKLSFAVRDESGTYTAVFTDDRTVLVTSMHYGASMRRVDVVTGAATTLDYVQGSTMLTASADRSVVGYAEAGVVAGKWGRYDVSTGAIRSASIPWFLFEIGVSRDASQFALPSYAGTFVYDSQFNQVGKVGVYADESPIGLVYSPVEDLVYFAWYDHNRTHAFVDVYDTQTLQRVAIIDDSPAVSWIGNWAFENGRLKIARDGSMLFATVPGGVEVYLLNPNDAPEITGVSAAWLARENSLVTVTASFTDVDLADVHTAMIDWGDGTTSTGAIERNAASGMVTAQHAYHSGGIYAVHVTVNDGQASDEATAQAVVTGAGLREGVLQIIGTDRKDRVSLESDDGVFEVEASFLSGRDHEREFPAAEIDRVEVHMFGGDDRLSVSSSVRATLFADGGAGHDKLSAGRGPSVLLGGAGKDQLKAGSGRSLLIGGTGHDRLLGGRYADILVAGSTIYDSRPTKRTLPHSQALLAILAEWDSTRSRLIRQRNILDGNGSNNRLNGSFFLKLGTTVFDDRTFDVDRSHDRSDWRLTS